MKKALVVGALALASALGPCHQAGAQNVSIVAAAPTLGQTSGNGGSLYEYYLGGGLLTQEVVGGAVVSNINPLPTSSVSSVSSGPITSFRATATSTATPLTSNAFTQGFVITANSTNTGSVCVGGSAVTTSTGYCLAAGYSISYSANNSNLAYIVDSTAGDTVSVSGN